MAETPIWKQVFDAVERRAGPALDELANNDDVATIAALVQRAGKGLDQAYASLLANLESSEYLAAHQAMHGWARDHIPFPGACFRQTAQWILRENLLAENRLVTDRRELDMGSIRCPVMNAVGTNDHLVPMESNDPIHRLIPHAEDRVFEAGHVGLIIGGRAQRVSIPGMAEWIEQHSDRAGVAA